MSIPKALTGADYRAGTVSVARPTEVVELTRMSVAVKSLPDEVRRGTFFERQVPASKMFVHFRDQTDGYARPGNVRRIKKLVDEWDDQAVGILLLSYRNDDSFAIIDGQHRVAAGGVKGVTAFDAYVYIDLSLEDEARLYRKFGDYLKQTPRDKFFAAIVEHEPEAVAIQRILGEHGLRVTNGQARDSVYAIDAVLKVAHRFGPQTLKDTIKLLHDAWGGHEKGYSSAAIVGTAMFLTRFGSDRLYRRKRLVERMDKLKPGGVDTQMRHVLALEKGDQGTAWGKAMRFIHNDHVPSQYQLGEWQDIKFGEPARESRSQNVREQWARKKGAA